MKPVYFEDLSSHYFVMKVIYSNGVAGLEKRRWIVSEGEGQLNEFRKMGPAPEAVYHWLNERSELVALAEPTKRWMDREWIPIEEINRFKEIIDSAVAASRARRNSNFLQQIFSEEAQ